MKEKTEQKELKRRDSDPPGGDEPDGLAFSSPGYSDDHAASREHYLPHLKIYVSGFDSSPYGIEWMRFESGSSISELIRTVPHIAFAVDDLEAAVAGKQLIGEVSSPSAGVKVAMFVDDGVAIEVLQFDAPGTKEPI